MNEEFQQELGDPQLKLSGLKIWVHGRQFPDAGDYWDGNWIRVTANCSASGASVWVTGSIIRLPELEDWVSESLVLLDRLKGEAALRTTEPELNVVLKARPLGQITMEVNITPDHMSQKHQFLFEIDQTYLWAMISSCKSILREFPIKGANVVKT